MAPDFKGVSEKFNVTLVSDDFNSERVVVSVGMDGLFISTNDGKRTLRKYPLNHISRWALRGNGLVLYTKTPVDVEEVTVTLQGDDMTIRSVLDTLTCSCMQMVELLQHSEHTAQNQQAANSLNQLLNPQKKKTSLPTSDEVEFWNEPEKGGWLYSQGEHIKNWRRRWHVLKSGYLFRFATADVTSGSKPRGIVDLSKVTDVSDGREATGKATSIKLSTATGSVLYVADSETEQVEWISALEGSVARIVKQVAGVEDEQRAASPPKLSDAAQWARQLEKSFSQVSRNETRDSYSRDTTKSRDRDRDPNPIVEIAGYDSAPTSRTHSSSTYGLESDMGRLGLDNVSGIAGLRSRPGNSTSMYPAPLTDGGSSSRSAYAKPANRAASFHDSFVKVDYPAYPVLTPTDTSVAPIQVSQQQYSAGSTQGYSYDQFGSTSLTQHAAPAAVPEAQPSYTNYASQPAAPYASSYQDSYQVSAHPPASQSASAAWQVHYTQEGRAYYFNTFTNVTQWEPPASLIG